MCGWGEVVHTKSIYPIQRSPFLSVQGSKSANYEHNTLWKAPPKLHDNGSYKRIAMFI